METQALTIEHVSAMPAATWHFLKMNDTSIELPDALRATPSVVFDVPQTACGAPGSFEEAMARAQEAWDKDHPAPTAEEIAEREKFLAAEADSTYGGTAQSPYQVEADAIEEARSLAVAFAHGTGDEVAAYLSDVAGERLVIAADAGQEVDARVAVSATSGASSVAAIDVVAAPRSIVNLSVLVDGSPDEGAGSSGVAGTTLRVFAEAGARVNVIRTQALDDGLIDIDDMGLFAADDANISVRQTVLGGASAFSGLAADLRGAQANVEVDTRYLAHGTQKRDFNYSLRHHGVRTTCDLQANGVLAGKSSKTLRGTIDFIRGCKGSEGTEGETVLLVDEGVRNKTVPVILCNEDDVAGSHGATIGHIRDEQLFYLASRGLSQEAAERLFVSAVVEQAVLDAPDVATRDSVIRFGERLAPGFAEIFEEER